MSISVSDRRQELLKKFRRYRDGYPNRPPTYDKDLLDVAILLLEGKMPQGHQKDLKTRLIDVEK